MQRVMKTTLPINVRAYEIDAMGVVSNIVYVKWLEDARRAFLDKFYPYDEMVTAGISPVMMKNEITYKKPLRITDRPTATLWITRLTKMRWEIYTEFTCEGILHCSAVQNGCFVEIETGRPTRVPKALMAAYEQDVSDMQKKA
ncbi:MAG: thioesterase family protein [Eubacteriales bacterium]